MCLLLLTSQQQRELVVTKWLRSVREQVYDNRPGIHFGKQKNYKVLGA